MLFGDRSTFAIDCEIASLHPPHRALGKFVVCLAGRRFGVDEPEATMLGSSIDALKDRSLDKGLHTSRALDVMPAVAIANTYLREVYLEAATTTSVDRRSFVWAPDGDEAFDDGSHILHTDTGSSVRLIGFQNTGNELSYEDVVELTISAGAFYSVLARCVEWYHGHFH